MLADLTGTIARCLTPQPIKLRADSIELTCYTPAGIDTIKKALRSGEKRSSTDRFYIGQVLDLYKRGANSRYGSVESASTAQGLFWLSLRVYLPLQLVRTSHFPLYISNILF